MPPTKIGPILSHKIVILGRKCCSGKIDPQYLGEVLDHHLIKKKKKKKKKNRPRSVGNFLTTFVKKKECCSLIQFLVALKQQQQKNAKSGMHVLFLIKYISLGPWKLFALEREVN